VTTGRISKHSRWRRPLQVVIGALALAIAILAYGVYDAHRTGSDYMDLLNKDAINATAALKDCQQQTSDVITRQLASDATVSGKELMYDTVAGKYGQGGGLRYEDVWNLLQQSYPGETDQARQSALKQAFIVMVNCQRQAADLQVQLWADVEDFDDWYGSWTIRILLFGTSFPNDTLRFHGNDQLLTGPAALDAMRNYNPLKVKEIFNAPDWSLAPG
jgi:hypothetical protein